MNSALQQFSKPQQTKNQKQYKQIESRNVMIPLDQLINEEVDISMSQYEAKRYNIKYDTNKDIQQQVLEQLQKICKKPENVLDDVLQQLSRSKSQVLTLPKYQHRKQQNVIKHEIPRMEKTTQFCSQSRIYDEWFEKQQALQFSSLSTSSQNSIMLESNNQDNFEKYVCEAVQKLKEKNERRLYLISQYKQWENRQQIYIQKHNFSQLEQLAQKGIQLALATNEQHYNSLTLNLLQAHIKQYTLDDKLLDEFEQKHLRKQNIPTLSKKENKIANAGRKKTIEKLIKQIQDKNNKLKELIQKYNDQKESKAQAIAKDRTEMQIQTTVQDVEKELPDMTPVEKRIEKQNEFIEKLQANIDNATSQDIIKLQQFLKTEYVQDQTLYELDKQIQKEQQDANDLKQCTFMPEVSQQGHDFKNETEDFVERFKIKEDYRVKKIETNRKKQQDKEMAPCTFKPEIGEKAQQIHHNENIFTRLQKHSQAKILVQSQLENLEKSGLDLSSLQYQDL